MNKLLALLEPITEYDDVEKVYTTFSKIIPQLHGEGSSNEKSTEKMLSELTDFINDFHEYKEISECFSDTQKHLIIELTKEMID